MLSERQKAVVVGKVNDDVDLPFVSESSEGRVIDKFVDRLNEHLGPALSAIMPDVYFRSLRIALSEDKSLRERRALITDLMRGEMTAPLTRELNDRVDCSVLPERFEGKILKIVADEIVEQFVKVCVGEIHEAFND